MSKEIKNAIIMLPVSKHTYAQIKDGISYRYYDTMYTNRKAINVYTVMEQSAAFREYSLILKFQSINSHIRIITQEAFYDTTKK